MQSATIHPHGMEIKETSDMRLLKKRQHQIYSVGDKISWRDNGESFPALLRTSYTMAIARNTNGEYEG